MTKYVEIFSKFPCKILEISVRLKSQPKYSKSIFYEFTYPDRLYITKDMGLLFCELTLERNQIIPLKNLKLEPLIVRNVSYERKSNDFLNEPFVHYFNGKEKFYTCIFQKKLVYYVSSDNDLWEKVIE